MEAPHFLFGSRRAEAISRILCRGFLSKTAVTTIHLGLCSRRASSHLPAVSPGRVKDCLLGVTPRRDCPFHPTRSRLVSVALIRTLRQAAVSCYGALWSPDFPREPKGSRDHRGELYPSGDCTKFQTFSPFDIQKNTPNCYIRQTAQRLSKLFDFYKKNNKLSLLIERLEISLTVHRQQPLSTL